MISIGRDSRVTGGALLEAAVYGVAFAGAQVNDFGLCTAPVMYMSTMIKGYELNGAVMITASHHPYQLNGLKFFWREGGMAGEDIQALLDRACDLELGRMSGNGKTTITSFLPIYAELLSSVNYLCTIHYTTTYENVR